MKLSKNQASFISCFLLAVLLINGCSPSKNLKNSASATEDGGDFNLKTLGYDAGKKTVLIIADNDGTEMFDMMAPFYLFNATGKANVYVVAEKRSRVIVKRGLFIMPQLTFAEVDSLHLGADLMVVPNQSGNPKKVTVDFIKTHYTGSNRILSVCDGLATVASTGIYDGKALTTHSSDYAGLKRQFKNPAWVTGLSVTQNGNLFSTAGVANATEGSLTVIDDLFGREVMQQVLSGIHYPYAEIKMDHENLLVDTNSTYLALRKGTIKKNEKVGVLLQNGISEFDMAGVLDTYFRSFPKTLETFSDSNVPVISKYGLTLLPTGDINTNQATEIHVLVPETFSPKEKALFEKAAIIPYDANEKQYIIDVCLKRIPDLYGINFAGLVKLMLDYN